MYLVAFACGTFTPTLAQNVTYQRFVLPRTSAWTGDFSGMLQRRTLRLLVPYSKTLFFVDRGRQMGVVAEFGRALEAWINARYKSKTLRFHVDLLPTARERLFEALNSGYGDAVAANLTITPDRLSVVDFADPWMKNVKEIIVTGPSSPDLDKIEDLAGREIRVRSSSVYFDHLAKLSDAFVKKGLAPIVIKPIDENLENDDLIEMVNAGLLPYAVVDDHEATIWTKMFPNAILAQISSSARVARSPGPFARTALN
jgi:membrane-bound lytic murein transglycosylase MltF